MSTKTLLKEGQIDLVNWASQQKILQRQSEVINHQLQNLYKENQLLFEDSKVIHDWNATAKEEKEKYESAIVSQLLQIKSYVSKFQAQIYLLQNDDSQQIRYLSIVLKLIDLEELQKLSEKIEHQFIRFKIETKAKTFAIGMTNLIIQTLSDFYETVCDVYKKNNKKTKTRDDKELLKQLVDVFPHYTLTQLRKHLEWFDQYKRLWERKKCVTNHDKIKITKERSDRWQILKDKDWGTSSYSNDNDSIKRQKKATTSEQEKLEQKEVLHKKENRAQAKFTQNPKFKQDKRKELLQSSQIVSGFEKNILFF
ncbi:viral A-type inclusion protein [Reticulomyxa filosa]|uniref:Viral A-type inclusion protein n=1 Tax=Reticulomyxa filosa TaxID=46433 RepID=X6P908_RETFI|nr:viral A-type inclusion protein [Reticulomyxa filosa]|eukprot:ETO34544.1 viral A-type inclusion protein [Reticulomyxa filosa]